MIVNVKIKRYIIDLHVNALKRKINLLKIKKIMILLISLIKHVQIACVIINVGVKPYCMKIFVVLNII
jgi:hypothetical protein